jgi:AraC-like DNA-binding protein
MSNPPDFLQVCGVSDKNVSVDALADVLAAARLGGAVFARTTASAPWGMAFEAAPMAGFHLVVRGSCHLRAADAGAAIELHQGDLALVCHGSPHTICSPEHARPTPFGELLASHPDPGGDLLFGGGGATTVLVCGGYHFDAGRAHPLLAILPPLIHVRTAAAAAGHDLSLVVELLTREVTANGIGTTTVTNRLVDALFVFLLRAWLEGQPAGVAGWLGALRDPVIGRAISLLHEMPGHPWRVEELARRVDMSRSGFAERFRVLTGDTPRRYLARLRADRAAQLLRESDDSILRIALIVGYANEQALSKAFARSYGMAPGRYRRAHRGT